MPMALCPRGHASSDPDYCDECGLRMGGSASPAVAAPAPSGELCPDCGSERPSGSRYCEVCRHDFQKGPAAPVPVPPPAAAPTPSSIPAAVDVAAPTPAPGDAAVMRNPWVVVTCDRSLMDPGGDIAFPEAEPERSYPVDLDEVLVGRRNGRAGVHADVPLADPSVSARHLMLSRRRDGGLYATDLDSSNGTRLNGRDLRPGVAERLADGDRLTLGAYSRITIVAR